MQMENAEQIVSSTNVMFHFKNHALPTVDNVHNTLLGLKIDRWCFSLLLYLFFFIFFNCQYWTIQKTQNLYNHMVDVIFSMNSIFVRETIHHKTESNITFNKTKKRVAILFYFCSKIKERKDSQNSSSSTSNHIFDL